MNVTRWLATIALGLTSLPAAGQESGAEDAAIEAASKTIEAAIASAEDEDEEAALAESDALDPAMVEIFDRGCGDDNGVDRCSPDEHAKMYELHGIPKPSEVFSQGASVRRTMFIDGYGNDVAAVTFRWSQGNGPSVEVHSPQPPIGRQYDPLVAPVSSKIWDEVEAAGRDFDRRLVGEEGSDGAAEAPIFMCLHGVFAVVEAIDAPVLERSITAESSDERGRKSVSTSYAVQGRAASYRVDSESACAQGLAVPYAFRLAELAIENLPQCSALSIEDFRSAFQLLAACHRLGGDRNSALRAADLLEHFNPFKGPLTLENIQYKFVNSMGAQASDFLSDIKGGFLGLGPPFARNRYSAYSEGVLFYTEEGQEAPSEYADIRLELAGSGDEFRVLSWTISDQKPISELGLPGL